MATARLTVEDKSIIVSRLEKVCGRLIHMTVDPFNEVGLSRIDFIKTLIPNDVCKSIAIILALKNESGLLAQGTYYNFYIQLEGNRKLSFSMRAEKQWVSFSQRSLWVPEAHPLYARLLKFGINSSNMRKRVAEADTTLSHVVHRCSSVGQIQRIIPTIMDFLPERLSKTMDGALRSSRAPNIDDTSDGSGAPERIEEALTVLAFGTLREELDREVCNMCLRAYKE